MTATRTSRSTPQPAQPISTGPRRTDTLARVGINRPPFTIDAAAERLGVTPRMVRRLVSERRIGFVKVGKFIRLRQEDLDAFLDEHFQPPLNRGAGK